MASSQLDSRLTWFTEARFGMFIHWGLYAIPGGRWQGQEMDYIGEWIQAQYRIPKAEYEKLAHQFDPHQFDADAWVRLAREAGMRYLVFTAKHHDGFAMYHSRVDAFNVVDATPFGRDPLAEIAEACRRHGLKLGIYYSQDLDWHHPDGGDPGPQFCKNLGMSWGNDWDFPDWSRKDFNRYYEGKALPQIRELLTQYGEISLLWFDCPVSMKQAHSEKLMQLVSELQPGCLVNSRIGNGAGDFGSMGDNSVPLSKPPGIWETAATLNHTWGFKYSDQDWKSSADILGILSALASRETNYLLNVGPKPDGSFPEGALTTLHEMRDWMQTNAPSIHCTHGNPFPSEFEWGWITVTDARGNEPAQIHLHRRDGVGGALVIRGLKTAVRHAYERAQPSQALPFVQTTNDPIPELRIDLPVAHGTTVTTLELSSAIEVDPRMMAQQGEVAILTAAAGCFRLAPRTALPQLKEEGNRVGAAGEKLQLEDTPRVDPSGVIVNWRNTNDVLEWRVLLATTGDYTVEILTSSYYFKRAWVGGHRVRFQVDGLEIEGELVASRAINTADTICYSLMASVLGVLHLEEGEHTVTLKADCIVKNDDLGLTLASVILRKQ